MKALIGSTLAAFALILAGCGEKGASGQDNAASAAPLKQIAAPTGDWTQTVVATPEGGFRMGNPEAPVKLVEYASLTCPHCREFEEQGVPTLRDKYVKSGQVSWEFRTYSLFPTDPGVSMLLHCQGAGSFFGLVEQLYAQQPEWSGKIQSIPQEQADQIQAMPKPEQARMLVRLTGLDQFFRERGLPAAKVDACLNDPQGLQKIVEITERGNKEGLTGTPTFFINGKIVENAATWRALEPALRSALP